MSSTLMMMQAASALIVPGDFDPETSITWHSLFWAEGTDFQAEGYSDTDNVTTWPNETGESDATQASGSSQPTYRSSVTALNNQPAVEGISSDKMPTAAFSVAPSYASGVSVVAIANTTSNSYIFGGIASGNRNCVIRAAGGWQIYAGSSVEQGGTSDNDAHLLVATFDGSTGNDTLTVDGTGVIDADSGSHTLTGVTLMGRYTLGIPLVGHLAFLGVYEGDVTADGSWSDFTDWAEDHYGLTIA